VLTEFERALYNEGVPGIHALIRDTNVSTRKICERLEISKAIFYGYVGPHGCDS